jgi:hypothetical protein
MKIVIIIFNIIIIIIIIIIIAFVESLNCNEQRLNHLVSCALSYFAF